MPSVYRRILGGELDRLPASLRRFHDIEAPWAGVSMARVERGATWLHRFVAAAGGLPPAREQCPLRLDIVPCVRWGRQGESWRRDFGGFVLESFQWAQNGLLMESFGWLSMAFHLRVEPPRLILEVAGVRCAGIPLPRLLAPGGTGVEEGSEDGVSFVATATAPLLGMVARYSGCLTEEPQTLPRRGGS
jgi:hypothetical protein